MIFVFVPGSLFVFVLMGRFATFGAIVEGLF
jgi:hypothetical protein